MMESGTSITHPKYRFGSCVLPFGSDSFSHVVRLRPLRRFILHSPCRTHPSGRVRRIPNVSALSQGLHTLVLLRTHALVGSMGNESHGYFTFPFFTFLLIAFMSHTRVRHIRVTSDIASAGTSDVCMRSRVPSYCFPMILSLPDTGTLSYFPHWRRPLSHSHLADSFCCPYVTEHDCRRDMTKQ